MSRAHDHGLILQDVIPDRIDTHTHGRGNDIGEGCSRDMHDIRIDPDYLRALYTDLVVEWSGQSVTVCSDLLLGNWCPFDETKFGAYRMVLL